MSYCSRRLGVAILAPGLLLTSPAAFAQNRTAPSAATDEAERSAARQAILWSQDRLAELDAAITVLERDAARRESAARERALAALADLRAAREAYRVKAEEALAGARAWSEAQAADANRSLDESWTTAQDKVAAYLDAVQADLATRRTVLEAEFEARRRTWQKSIDELRAEASRLSVEQRAMLQARIEAFRAQVDEARARVARVQETSWAAMRRSYAETQRSLSDAYLSIRKAMEQAAR